MPGWGPIGQFAIGDLAGAGSAILVGVAGSFAFTGSAATFTVKENVLAGSYAVTGHAATFTAKLATVAASYALTGSAATFQTTLGAIAGSYAVSGFPTGAIVMVAQSGSVVFSGLAAQFAIAESASGTAYIVTGNAAHFTRDFINWLPRPFVTDAWAATGQPAQTWTAATVPNDIWTANPAMAIPKPVTS